MKKEQIKVIYSRYGLSNFYGNYIEINEHFKYNKPLRDYVVKHELGHIKSFDLLHEFQIEWKLMPKLFLFILKHPSTWIDFLPFQIKRKRFVYDLNLIILYLISLALIFTSIKLFF